MSPIQEKAGIKIEKPDPARLKELGVESWGIWSKEPSEFPWHYDEQETFLLIEGEVEVTTEDGQKVQFGPGDYVVLPKGLSCTWNVKQAVRKHYKFG